MAKKFVFVCCPAISGFTAAPGVHLSLTVILRPDTEESTAPLSTSGGFLSCRSTFTFEYTDVHSSNLCFHVRPTNSVLDVARLTLPLAWFQLNAVVKYAFPMKMQDQRLQVFMHAEVHLCEDQSGAFAAEEGGLTVAPQWAVPGQAQPYPPQQPMYPPQQPMYAPQQPLYPPQQPMYPPQQPMYAGQHPMYPPQQPMYPPQQAMYAPQQAMYPPPQGPAPVQYIAVRPQCVVDPRTGQWVWSYVLPDGQHYQIPAASQGPDPDQPPILADTAGLEDDGSYVPQVEVP